MRKQALLFLALLVPMTGCEQVSQELPFDVDPDAPISKSISPSGGTISTPEGLAIHFPSGSLSSPTQVTVEYLGSAAAFPGEVEGELIPESVYEVTPRAVLLNTPAQLGIRLAARTLTDDEQLRVGFAVEGPSGPLMVEDVSYDLTSGLVLGPLPALGVLGVRIAEDVIPIEEGEPPDLGGGNFGGEGAPAQPTPRGNPGDGGAEQATAESQVFTVNCGSDADQPRCLDSDALKIWASLTVQNRFQGELILVGPRVEGAITFSDFVGGNPTKAQGTFRVTGILRVKVGQSVASYEVDEVLSTGSGGDPSTTGVQVSGASLIFQNTSEGANESFPFGLVAEGTGTRLMLEAVEDVELENDDGTITTGKMIIHLRLRR